MIRGTFVEQEVAPQHDHGVDWSRKGRVLVRTAARRLIWRFGGKYFGGIGQRNYAPACLRVERIGEWGAVALTDFLVKDLTEGGKLTQAKVKVHLPAICQLLELPDLTMAQIDLKRTYVVETTKACSKNDVGPCYHDDFDT